MRKILIVTATTLGVFGEVELLTFLGVRHDADARQLLEVENEGWR